MKNERVLIFFKFISMVFLILFLLLNIACISYYENKFTFVLMLILFMLFFIPGLALYKNLINIYLIKDYKQVEEKSSEGKIYRFSKINSTIINDYQIAIKDLKEKNSYILGRYDVLDNIKKQYKKDMKKARKLQENMMPKKMPNNNKINSASLYKPLETIGGDFFDYIYLDDDRILFIISDISGHGVEAAIITAMFKTVFRNLAASFKSPSSFIYDINNYIIKILPINYYLTMTVAEIDLKNKVVKYSNASHTPMLILENSQIKEYNKGGTIIGLFPQAYYEEEIVNIKKDDVLIFYTDGVTEASRSKNKYDFYGIDRLKKVIFNNKNSKAENIISNIEKDFYDYLSYMSPDDDFTIAAFKIKI
ncbi:PP2C family protein-serine/threonine phosphatase [Brachyspira hyodysenteriae]|nr:PP2C family protein-serine/threonine phosphatase [Brachyspira hyodysenteriae]KLI39336.1 serine/threonine protein phosphatase [Brachyspira hyodysenteriae]MCZ9839726.1 SpoIIE family protein phosphatase [Brachyspira hyodysenteriae]MCZ9847367.1 SpoIIE family protein phosphatase [Brachyspira hyodysenteriae]MCZ9851046.1 SpoIIE family protein phosphatase [Brachyspira hyodysenteriae]MCZ9860201.1 SpoIIE family protein phosphatase [Brachyspira hyodysenteriae]